MTGLARGLRYTAFTLMAIVGAFGALFIAGELFNDPGGAVAVALIALWLVPLLALAAAAWWRPDRAAPWFVGATVLVATFALLDAALELVPRDQWGPVTTIAVFALGVPLAFLALRRPLLGGLLLVVAALAQLAAGLVTFAGHGDGPGAGAMLGGSVGVAAMPMLVAGVLFLVAARLARESPSPGHAPRAPSAP